MSTRRPFCPGLTTSQTRLETARAAERRYRLLFENNPAGMFRTRPDGRVIDCNPAAVAILGYASSAAASEAPPSGPPATG